MKQIQEIPILGRKSSRSCQSIRKGASWNRSLYTAVIGEKDYKKALKAIFDAGYARIRNIQKN
ncbi:hypothetical protein SRABI133_02831 [Peribacillus simplex]|uniref:Uncharacterized protein n=1 Tax=Peribacillus simplex TaxID=1478 RepID=A0A9W4KW26_9BACI|nr:hypothetical protein SRABI133_02831 [Peribacillus simplex]